MDTSREETGRTGLGRRGPVSLTDRSFGKDGLHRKGLVCSFQ